MYKFTSLIIVILSCSVVFGQQKYWQANDTNTIITTDKAVARQSFPATFKLFHLDIDLLKQDLSSVTSNQLGQSTIIVLPNADGGFEQFEVFEASNFEPDLQAQFPEIRAFSGKGITDKYATLKLSVSPQGIQTMVFRTEKEDEFIEPYSSDHTVYAVFKSRRKKGELPWTCSTVDHKIFSDLKQGIGSPNRIESSAGQLKTMRLAQSCTGEYSNYFGAFNSSQVALVLAAFNATLTRANGVYEKDLALHLNLIAGTTNVIYYNAATDPYSDAAAGANGA
ncbi:MAG TPA: peptidase, partial [Chitinophagaceae bacterium]|nr:peptidase [Chitinophagaceae bacterium]